VKRRTFLVVPAGVLISGCSALHAAPISNSTNNPNPNIKKINFYSDGYQPTEEDEKAQPEKVRMDKPVKTRRWVQPVDAPIGTPYRQAGSSWSSGYHTGTDFAAPNGTPIRAVGAGVVIYAGAAGQYGNQVVIQHDHGTFSQYAHLSKVQVKRWQAVDAGHVIGRVGSTGNSSGPHLHFEMRNGPAYGSDMDPVKFLRNKGVSL
jgi:murein DD-endopeptidase MepM/ murein hydrolase activator NlpD